jgi:hypothetical protein
MKPQRPEKEAHSPEPSRDAVEINSEDSFPASDASSWTPVCTENFIRIDWPKESPNVSAP